LPARDKAGRDASRPALRPNHFIAVSKIFRKGRFHAKARRRKECGRRESGFHYLNVSVDAAADAAQDIAAIPREPISSSSLRVFASSREIYLLLLARPSPRL
jgi:hypothetical protein